MDWKTFFFGAAVGMGMGWLLWTESGKLIAGIPKAKLKADLIRKAAALAG